MFFFFFFQAEDGIRDLVRSRGLGDVYKRQVNETLLPSTDPAQAISGALSSTAPMPGAGEVVYELSLIHI